MNAGFDEPLWRQIAVCLQPIEQVFDALRGCGLDLIWLGVKVKLRLRLRLGGPTARSAMFARRAAAAKRVYFLSVMPICAVAQTAAALAILGSPRLFCAGKPEQFAPQLDPALLALRQPLKRSSLE